MIYIATDEHGKGVRQVTPFYGRKDLLSYAWEVMACRDGNYKLNGRPTIDDICDALYDCGPGSGARHHYRIPVREAKWFMKNRVDSI